MTRRTLQSLKRLGVYLIAAVICFWALFPFYWALSTSLKTGSELFSSDLFPKVPTLTNYRQIFIDQPFEKNFLNSVIVATLTVGIGGILSLFAAYIFARRSFQGRNLILLTFLFVSMFPQISLLSGLFELIRALGLYNNPLGLVFSYTTFILPFTVWTLTVFMRDIPKGIEDAAILDGANPLTIVLKIIVPMMAPSLVTTGLLGFIAVWNEFLFALTFSLTDRSRTVPVAIAFISGSSEHEIPWGMIMAASVAVTLPIIAIVLIFQKRIVAGLTAGSIKG